MLNNLPYYMTYQLNLYWSGVNEVIRCIAILLMSIPIHKYQYASITVASPYPEPVEPQLALAYLNIAYSRVVVDPLNPTQLPLGDTTSICMLSLYRKATKLLPRTVEVLSILVLLCRSYVPLCLSCNLRQRDRFQK